MQHQQIRGGEVDFSLCSAGSKNNMEEGELEGTCALSLVAAKSRKGKSQGGTDYVPSFKSKSVILLP